MTRFKEFKILDWEFMIYDENDENSCCFPGGKVATNLEYYDTLSKDECAHILGHEIAHAICRHAAEEFTMYAIQLIFYILFSNVMPFEVDSSDMDLLIDADWEWLELSFSRQMEAEADEIGIYLTKFAGYDIQVAINTMEEKAQRDLELFWELAEEIGVADEVEDSDLDEFEEFSTHPLYKNRLKNMKRIIAKLNSA